jgi:hypothetical protein
MSKHNKVNKSNYVQGGRLTPDEMARERKRQAEVSSHAKGKERIAARASVPPKPSEPGALPRAPRARSEGDERGASRPRSAPEE